MEPICMSPAARNISSCKGDFFILCKAWVVFVLICMYFCWICVLMPFFAPSVPITGAVSVSDSVLVTSGIT